MVPWYLVAYSGVAYGGEGGTENAGIDRGRPMQDRRRWGDDTRNRLVSRFLADAALADRIEQVV
jgi:hypothetical protein